MVKGRNTTVIGIRILDSDWAILKKVAKDLTVSAYVKQMVLERVAQLKRGKS